MFRAAIALIAGCSVASQTLTFSADAARGPQPAIYFSASIKTPAQNASAQ